MSFFALLIIIGIVLFVAGGCLGFIFHDDIQRLISDTVDRNGGHDDRS